MILTEKQQKRATAFYNALKNFMSLEPNEFAKSKIEICKDCNGTGLSVTLYNKDSGDYGWNGTDYCDRCYGVGFININSIDSKFKSLTDSLYICSKCGGVGCSKCDYTGLVDWIKNVMVGK